MAAPTFSSFTPATVVAGALPVSVAIGGSNFASGLVVTAPGLTFSNVVVVDGTHVTAKVSTPGGTTRGPVNVTVTNLDAGTATRTAATSVVAPAVTGSGDYAYANPLPGTVPGTNAVGVVDASVVVESGSLAAPAARPYVDMVSANGMRSEASMATLNPAYTPAAEAAHGGPGQALGAAVVTPIQEASLAPGDRAGDNPAADDLERDDGFPVGDEHTAQLPLAPTITSAVAGADTHATVHWTAPVDPDGYDITGYEVVATSSDGGTTRTYEVGDVLTIDATSLTSGKHYTFTVAAKNTAGTGPASAASSSVPVGASHALTYNGNTNTGGTAPVDGSSPYAFGATVTVAAVGSLVKIGSTFDGWNTAANGSGTAYDPADTFSMPNSVVTLYAQWV